MTVGCSASARRGAGETRTRRRRRRRGRRARFWTWRSPGTVLNGQSRRRAGLLRARGHAKIAAMARTDFTTPRSVSRRRSRRGARAAALARAGQLSRQCAAPERRRARAGLQRPRRRICGGAGTDRAQARLAHDLGARIRPQEVPPDVDYLFAPLKHARLDYMAQKAVEMGARRLRPVITSRTQVSRVNLERLAANAREAASNAESSGCPRSPSRNRSNARWPTGRASDCSSSATRTRRSPIRWKRWPRRRSATGVGLADRSRGRFRRRRSARRSCARPACCGSVWARASCGRTRRRWRRSRWFRRASEIGDESFAPPCCRHEVSYFGAR